MKRLQKLAKKIYDITLEKGGYTDPREKGRYIVAHPSHETKIQASEFSATKVLAFLKVCENHNLSIGTWYNKSEQIFVLDAVTSFDNIQEAARYALSSKQLAIYDIHAKTEIYQNDYIKYI